jgi:hypothetical protein
MWRNVDDPINSLVGGLAAGGVVAMQKKSIRFGAGSGIAMGVVAMLVHFNGNSLTQRHNSDWDRIADAQHGHGDHEEH